MKPFIVVADGMDKHTFKSLQAITEFEVHPSPKVTQEELLTLLPRTSALVIRSASKVTAESLEISPNLKYVIRAGEGTDNIDKVACGKKGVKVSNTPGANSNSVAELAISLMINVLRKTAWAHATMVAGKWEKNKYEGNELSYKSIGFIGFGKIAQLTAKRLSGFDPDVLYYDTFPVKTDLPYARQARDLEQIFSECDIITMHIPKTKETSNLVDKRLLSLMKKEAILINTARGGLVNEDDLCTFLKEGKIRGAGIDVFAIEPLPEGSKLSTLENVVLTPHLGASTGEAQIRVGEMAVHQLKEFFIKNQLLNEVKA
ncbi:MAG: hydroxyacid dehydrogenase [Oligoflexia bacterium]|nr:hydroxyacid dehydrogenase [Oligoflexia bacterium]MBF0364056.1 hydroxyacid dehydrogenase [Oligoflexia bacterium]